MPFHSSFVTSISNTINPNPKPIIVHKKPTPPYDPKNHQKPSKLMKQRAIKLMGRLTEGGRSHGAAIHISDTTAPHRLVASSDGWEMRPTRERQVPLRVCPTVRQVYGEPPHIILHQQRRRPVTARPAASSSKRSETASSPVASPPLAVRRLQKRMKTAVLEGADPARISSLRGQIREAERKGAVLQVDKAIRLMAHPDWKHKVKGCQLAAHLGAPAAPAMHRLVRDGALLACIEDVEPSVRAVALATLAVCGSHGQFLADRVVKH